MGVLIQILGWVGFVLLIYAYTRRDILTLRLWTILATIFLFINAFWLKAWALAAVQGFVFLLNIYLYKQDNKPTRKRKKV